MDKETLSNYGWIVICVLVLAVMIALATPFGTFVADGFKATYTGLFQTGDNALDVGLSAVGVSNKLPCGHGRKEAGDHSQKECGHYNCQDTDCGCVPASCGIDGHWSNDGKDHTTVVNHTGHTYACQCSGWVVPEGGTFTMRNAINGKSVYTAGEQLPCGYESYNYSIYNDTYKQGDYLYTYHRDDNNVADSYGQGWSVAINTAVTDKNQKTYGPIISSINNEPVVDMINTFKGCTSLEIVPDIPNSVTNLSGTFWGCSSLVDLSNLSIPNSVTNMGDAFRECTSLTVLPTIPNNVTSMYGTFYGCTSLKNISSCVIPNSVTSMMLTFAGCTEITNGPDMSNATGVTNMQQTFASCRSLTVAPDLSNCIRLENMDKTFSNTAITVAPIIPATVTNMDWTFNQCFNLTGTITINANPSSYSKCFQNVDMTNITLTGSASKDVLNLIGSTGKNWTPIS